MRILQMSLYFLVKQVVELVPEAKELIVKLKERSDRIHIIGTNLGFNVSALREKITIARGEASRVCILGSQNNICIWMCTK